LDEYENEKREIERLNKTQKKYLISLLEERKDNHKANNAKK
jgi:hypothetical protein